MIGARQIAWTLITATAAVIAVGSFVQEFGLALASVALGAAAMGASLFARKTVARDSSDAKQMRGRLLQKAA